MARIYVSSTYSDLEQYRKAVHDVLLRMGHDVVGMEVLIAGDQTSVEVAMSAVANSDIYIGIIAWRYGYIPSDDNPESLSIVELEYRQARQLGLPILLFLVDEEEAWPNEHFDAVTGEGEKEARIDAFRRQLMEEHIVSMFTTPDNLTGLVAAAVSNYLAQSGGKLAAREQARVEQWSQHLADLLRQGDMTWDDLCTLAFRAVLLLRHDSSPSMLVSFELAELKRTLDKITSGVEGKEQILRAGDRLAEELPDVTPNPLWVAWMETTYGDRFESRDAAVS